MLVDEHGNAHYKVLVAIPAGEMCHSDFAYDLARLTGYTSTVRPDINVLVYLLKGTYLPRARARLAQEALDQSCTHILWLDTDMRFPKDALLHLLTQGRPIVCANYATRQAPIIPTAYNATREPMFEGGGEVGTAGMGLMLTETAVFQAIPKPWFAIGYSKDADDYSGEDTFFCMQAAKYGFPVWVDEALSEQVSHRGGFTFELAHARMTRDAAQESVSGTNDTN